MKAFEPVPNAACVSREKDIEAMVYFCKEHVLDFLRCFEIINLLADTKHPQTCGLLQTDTQRCE